MLTLDWPVTHLQALGVCMVDFMVELIARVFKLARHTPAGFGCMLGCFLIALVELIEDF